MMKRAEEWREIYRQHYVYIPAQLTEAIQADALETAAIICMGRYGHHQQRIGLTSDDPMYLTDPESRADEDEVVAMCIRAIKPGEST